MELDVGMPIAIFFIALILAAFQKGLTKKLIPLAWGIMVFCGPFGGLDWYLISVYVFILLLALLIQNLHEAGKI